MIKIIFLLLSLSYTALATADSGVLFLAHGSMMHHQMNDCSNSSPSKWEQAVLKTVDSIKTELPYKSEVAFGMWNSKCIDAGITRLGQQIAKTGGKLDHLIVLPIFISSYSAVIEMQKYIFNKRADRVIPIPSVVRTSFTEKITYLNAIDYNPHISMILANRFHHLIHLAKDEGYQSKQMELVFVMHGPVTDKDNIEWMKMGKQYTSDINYLFPVHKTHVISLRDDADAEVRDRATLELRNTVESATRNNRIALVLPLLLSKGGIEAGILKRLSGLDYIWSGEMLLPDAKLASFLIQRIQKEASSK